MLTANRLFIVQTFLLISLIGHGFGQRDKYLGGLIDFLNNLPNQPYVYEDGLLLNSRNVGENIYKLEVSLKASDVQDPKSFKLLKCTATVQDNGESGITVQENEHQCHEDITHPPTTEAGIGGGEEVGEDTVNTDAPLQEVPVRLDNEVQSDTAVTSGEQFVAIPRPVPQSPCIGCSSAVNPEAPGVRELALLALRHLDRHDPPARHQLRQIVNIERQVQVVNGVRYILTINVDYDNCTISETDACSGTRTCKVSILEKPWVKLPDGSKFRAILSNNCTENWLFGDDGEVLPPAGDTNRGNDSINSINDSAKHVEGTDDDLFKAIYHTDTQAKPPTERTLSEHELKLLEEQIIPNHEYPTEALSVTVTTETNIGTKDKNAVYKEQNAALKDDTMAQKEEQFVQKENNEVKNEADVNVNKEPTINSYVDETKSTLSDEKKKDIDALFSFINYAGLESNPSEKELNPRMKRSFNEDLKLLELTERFKHINKQVADGTKIVKLGEFLVNYMNEMDIELKSRELKDIINAEGESDNDRQFVYIQARVYTPCGEMGCESNENLTNICNAIIDNTDTKSPQVLNHFCYKEDTNKINHGKVTMIPLDDPVLQKLADDVLKKMEAESDIPNAINLRVLGANTRKTSGVVTQMSVEYVFTNCNKTVPRSLRDKCAILENVGSNVCEVLIVNRSWLKDNQITYTCIKRNFDESISPVNAKKLTGNMKDPKILAMAQLALQHLEQRSNEDHKQKVVDITKVSTQLVAGLLTNLEFVVGYTTCLQSDPETIPEKCKLFNGAPLRHCEAQIWDRSWLVDGKQVNVKCDDVPQLTTYLNNNEVSRKKRHADYYSGYEIKDPTDPKYQILAEESLQKYLDQTKSSDSWKIFRVTKVTTELVSGTSTKIKFYIENNKGDLAACLSEIWEQPWLKKKDITVACDLLKQKRKLKFIRGRETEENPNKTKYKHLAKEAMNKYLEQQCCSNARVTKVLRVTTKEENGLRTRIGFVILQDDSTTLICEAIVLERLILDSKDIDVNCSDSRRQAGPHVRDLSDPQYAKIANDTLYDVYFKKIPKMAQNGAIWNELNVTRVSSTVDPLQWLSGFLLNIAFEVNNTGVDTIGKTLSCNALIWNMTWIHMDNAQIHCDLVARRTELADGRHSSVGESQKSLKSKRDILVGGFMVQDPKDKKYMSLAKNAFNKYTQESGSSGEVIRVLHVATQVVAGLKTLVKFEVAQNGTIKLICTATVLDQSWLNNTHIDVACDKLTDRQKRGLGGAKKEKDPKDPKYQTLAEESLKQHVSQKGLTGVWNVAEVTKVTYQVVAGSSTEIDFKSIENGGRVLYCHSKVWEQPWLNKKVIEIDCQENVRQKRQLGGITEKDPKDPKYQTLAEESLKQHVSQKGLTGVWNVAEVTKVTYQVVAGSSTEIDFKSIENGGRVLYCHSKVWEQPWLNKKVIEIDCQENVRQKRQLGGITEKDPKDPKYQTLAEESLKQHVSQKGLTGVWNVAEVTKVTYQVVAGSSTEIDFKSIENGGRVLYCHSKVWEQPWLNKKVIEIDCRENVRQKREPGGITEKDPKDPKYRTLAEESLKQHVSQKGLTGVWNVAEVTKVTYQVVAGSSTEIDFKSIENGGRVLYCHSKVWEQPWLNKKVIEIDCQENVRQKRQLGGITEKDPKDPKYQTLAEESLKQHVSQEGLTGVWNVAEVTRVTYQVVAGSSTEIDFKSVENGGRVLYCHSKVWEQPWLNKKDIEIDCRENVRQKREPGGITEKDPKDPKYRTLAEESLKQHVSQKGLTGVWNVAEVTKVTYQVVAGSSTEIDFKSIENGGRVLYCHSKVWEQPWLNKKVIEIDCQENVRQKRQLGGITEKDPKDPKYQTLAKESLKQHVSQKGLTGVWNVAEVTKVTYQVVAGSSTEIDFKSIENGGRVLYCHSKVWEQPWLNKKVIEIDCQENVRQKRQLGGITEKDPKDPKYQTLAEESLKQHVSQKGLTGVWNVAEVTKVTYQVVAGSSTEIDFKSIENGGRVLYCHSKVWEQPWLNKKVIEIDCQENVRQKRQFGGITEKDPKDPKYQTLAEESLKQHVSQEGLTGVWNVAEVTRVTYQVVAGSSTEIDFKSVENGGRVLNCHSKVWEQPWLNKKDIEIDCRENVRQKREPGGITEKDPKDPKYRTLAEESLKQHVSQKGLTGVWNVAEVTKVTYQVVAGSSTEIDFKSIENGGRVLYCHSKVWEQPWLNKIVIEIDCQENVRQKRQLGGITEKDPKDPKYQTLAEESLKQHVSQKGLTGVWNVAEVTKVTYQVVAGSSTEIDFKSIENGGRVLYCHSKVWEQPWLNKKVIEIDCQENVRQKRQLGGITEKDPKDPKYQTLAEESLKQHVSQKGLTGVWNVAEVTKVTYQVVAGSSTEIDFKSIENGGRVLYCHSKVWEQPWLNKKVIEIDCQENMRQKRDVIGGLKEMIPTDHKYQVLAEESLQQHLSQNGLNGVWKVANVNRVTHRVVAGSSTEIDFDIVENNGQILSCHSEVWEQPWLETKQIQVGCHDAGLKNSDTQQENENRQLANEALMKYDKDYNSKYWHKVIKLLHVYRYNVSALVNAIDFTMAPTKCLRTDDDMMKPSCDVDTSKSRFTCHAFIEVKNHDKVILTQCVEKKVLEIQKKQQFHHVKKYIDKSDAAPPTTSDVRFKRQIRPDDYEIDNDTKFLYAEKALDDLNVRSNTQNMQKLIAIHSTSTSMQMGTTLVRMFIEVGYTYCLKQNKPTDMSYCDELDGLNHRLCLVKIYPAEEDDTVVKHITAVCDDEQEFEAATGLNILELIKASIKQIELNDKQYFKVVHQGEPNIVPSLDSSEPIKLSFIVATTNCTKYDVADVYDLYTIQYSLQRKDCVVMDSIRPKECSAYIWMSEKRIKKIKVSCSGEKTRIKRSLDGADENNSTQVTIEELVNESIQKLEQSNIYKFKQRVLQVNNYNTKITTGKLTTIDFDVGYTSCLKYEWVDDITKCEFLEHLPRRHCVSMVYERLWISNGKKFEVNCEDDESPLEVHTEFDNAQLATSLGDEVLKHIEYKYPHPQRQKVVRIFSVDKQTIAGLHYRLKLEVGFTDCLALSVSDRCNLVKDKGDNKFCRANVWLRPWTEHPPIVRVVCDYQEAATADLYHQIQVEHLFYDFLTTHRPTYMDDPVEMRQRFQIFKANVRKIHELNTRERGTARYAVTQFADLSYEEFFGRHLGLSRKLRAPNQIPLAPARIPEVEVPDSFDWRERGAVTEVKNQGSCGSCWAFSVTGNIEGQYKLKTGKLLSLSEQELVDCDQLDKGCNGGMPDNAYRSIEAMGGLETEDDYPYEGEDDKCVFNKTLAKVQLSGAVNISSNETDMAKWLVQNGPISIGINANAMQFYVGGVSHPWRMLCNPNNIDHGVLIVGYGVKNYPLFHKTMPYWIVKNSWGPSWGEQGYYRVYRGDGTCGVNTLASSAILATPGDE